MYNPMQSYFMGGVLGTLVVVLLGGHGRYSSKTSKNGNFVEIFEMFLPRPAQKHF